MYSFKLFFSLFCYTFLCYLICSIVSMYENDVYTHVRLCISFEKWKTPQVCLDKNLFGKHEKDFKLFYWFIHSLCCLQLIEIAIFNYHLIVTYRCDPELYILFIFDITFHLPSLWKTKKLYHISKDMLFDANRKKCK